MSRASPNPNPQSELNLDVLAETSGSFLTELKTKCWRIPSPIKQQDGWCSAPGSAGPRHKRPAQTDTNGSFGARGSGQN